MNLYEDLGNLEKEYQEEVKLLTRSLQRVIKLQVKKELIFRDLSRIKKEEANGKFLDSIQGEDFPQ